MTLITGERLKQLHNRYAVVLDVSLTEDYTDKAALCTALFMCALYRSRYSAHIRGAYRLLYYLRKVYFQSYLQRGAGLFFLPMRTLSPSKAHRLDLFFSCSTVVFQGERYIIPEIEGMGAEIISDRFYRALAEKGAFTGDFPRNQFVWLGWAGGHVDRIIDVDALPVPTDVQYPVCEEQAEALYERITYPKVFEIITAAYNLLSRGADISDYLKACGCYLRTQTRLAAGQISDLEARALYEAIASVYTRRHIREVVENVPTKDDNREVPS